MLPSLLFQMLEEFFFKDTFMIINYLQRLFMTTHECTHAHIFWPFYLPKCNMQDVNFFEYIEQHNVKKLLMAENYLSCANMYMESRVVLSKASVLFPL